MREITSQLVSESRNQGKFFLRCSVCLKCVRKSILSPLSPHLLRPEGGDLVDDVLFENADARGQHGRPEEDVGDARPRVGLADVDAAVPDGEDGHEAAEAFKQFLKFIKLPKNIYCELQLKGELGCVNSPMLREE